MAVVARRVIAALTPLPQAGEGLTAIGAPTICKDVCMPKPLGGEGDSHSAISDTNSKYLPVSRAWDFGAVAEADGEVFPEIVSQLLPHLVLVARRKAADHQLDLQFRRLVCTT